MLAFFKKRKNQLLLIAILLLSVFIYAGPLYFGVLTINHPSKKEYTIRGVDVSYYQGDIRWETLAGGNIEFAFIKATEGSSYVDPKSAYNLEKAGETNLMVGAYHFLSYDSSGETQAENFIQAVPASQIDLPPVIDVEFYGDKEQNPPTKEQVDEILGPILQRLEEHYQKKPILYFTEKTYALYLNEGYEEYPLWVRSVYAKPTFLEGAPWIFWQYSNRKRLKGYDGEERYIDMNAFYGDREAFGEFVGSKITD